MEALLPVTPNKATSPLAAGAHGMMAPSMEIGEEDL